MKRRTFLQHSSAINLLAFRGQSYPLPEPKLLAGSRLERFVDRLPLPSVARPVSQRPAPGGLSESVPYIRVVMREFSAKVHRDVPPTRLWGYEGCSPGPIVEARSGQPLFIEWQNALPQQHLFAIDHNLHGAEISKPEVRTVVHLHGGRTPPESDGYPESWFTPGHSFLCYYPNRQDAATLFYHDHAMGITRLNAMAGLFGLYIIRDAIEDLLPLPKGKYEVPLILYDRTFTTEGQLHYPDTWVSEFIGDTILVNGKIAPFLEVEPRRYRFRVLNASNGGFYFLSLTKENEPAMSRSFWQIGSDQGLFSSPVSLQQVFLAPAERADIIIDFAPYNGQNLLLRSQAAVAIQFRVSSGSVKDLSAIPPTLRSINRLPESSSTQTRDLSLADHQDRLGQSHKMLLNGQHWSMPVTERPSLNSIETWSFINLTDDTHPIHLHLVRFQILDRRPFDMQVYEITKQLVWTGPPVPPDPNEMGWKDTVRVPPTLVTRIIVDFKGYAGRYVWHCHVLEHEDNEMMRPYEIL